MSEKELPQAKPRQNKAKAGYLFHQCPNCGTKFRVESYPVLEVETDEFGRLKRDVNGQLIPKTRISYSYQTFTRLVSMTENDQEIHDALRERTEKERAEIIQLTEDLSKKKEKKKNEPLMEQTA
jgi:hypothetical protein